MQFTITKQSKNSLARSGFIRTSKNNVIRTPAFVPVATNGALKTLTFKQAEDLGVELIFVNSLHVLINSNIQEICRIGGIHAYTGRSRGFISDSGGFQLYSFGKDKILSKSTENGIIFRSYRDGKKIALTPESCIANQHLIGCDIILVLDELLGFHELDLDLTKASMVRSHVWAERSLNHHLKLKAELDMEKKKSCPALYGIVHGGFHRHLRVESAKFINGLEHFDGFAIGGSLGKSDDSFETLKECLGFLDKKKPVHLLGIGDLKGIRKLVTLGIDSFDSAYPTQIARHGAAIVSGKENLNLKSSALAADHGVVDETCNCEVCATQKLSRSYLQYVSFFFSFFLKFAVKTKR